MSESFRRQVQSVGDAITALGGRHEGEGEVDEVGTESSVRVVCSLCPET
jgi:hypothetical protein